MLTAWLLIALASLIYEPEKVPNGLMVEFIREPQHVRILDLKPEFSWIVPEEAVSQTAFRIIVATSREKAEKDIADIWDSGKVGNASSTEVEYGGKELSPGTSFFWKVRIWDHNGKQTSWSAIQSFVTGSPSGYKSTANHFEALSVIPAKIEKVAAGDFFADFGKDAFGNLIIEFAPSRVDTIIVHLGEKLDKSNHIDRNPGGSIRYYRIKLPVEPGRSSYLVQTSPDKMNTGRAAVHLPDSFGVVTPFRYCELENFNSELKKENLARRTFWHYFDDGLSSFSCSDTILNNIWKICKYSIKATSFTGLYIDGDRERIPYEGDAYINQLGHYCTDREYSMARRTNEYFIDHPTWPTEWILQTVLMFYNDYMYTGNIELVSNYYDALKHKTLLSLAGDDGLISSQNVTGEIMKSIGFSDPNQLIRDIVDWPPAQKDTKWQLVTPEGERDGYDMVPVNTVVNAFHYRNLVLMAELAGRLGKNADSVFFAGRAAKVYDSFNSKLMDQKKGIYVDGISSEHSSLHANMMALAFDLVPEKYRGTVVSFIRSRGMACSVYGSQYLLEALYKAGAADYALSLLTSTSGRSWWNMIRSGSTITLEAWDMKYKPNSDWNHAWGAAPANIIPRHLWGIIPAKPGFSKAIIKPQLASLTSSFIEVPTIRGIIKAEYKINKGKREYSIILPANMTADFIIRDENKSINLNGKNTTSVNGKIFLRPGFNRIVL
jgi:hypothetical protein